MLRGDSLYKANTDYNDHKDTCKRCKLRQREQVFNGGSYFYVSAANDFLKSSTDPSKPKPAGICKWELDVVNNFPIQFPYGFGGPSQQRRTKTSANECLRHYAELSLDQFKKGDFLLVCWNLIADLSTQRLKCSSSEGSRIWNGLPNRPNGFLDIKTVCAMDCWCNKCTEAEKIKNGMLVKVTNLSCWEKAQKRISVLNWNCHCSQSVVCQQCLK